MAKPEPTVPDLTGRLAAQPHLGRAKDTTAVKLIRRLARAGILFQPVEAGPLPALYAATHPAAQLLSVVGDRPSHI